MTNKTFSFLIIFFVSSISLAQQAKIDSVAPVILFPEINFGHSFTDYDEFPDRKPQFNVLLNLGWSNQDKSWDNRFQSMITGVSLGYSSFGNYEKLGNAFSLMPFMKFDISKSKRFSMLLSIGTSYFTEKFNEEQNFGNKAISTDFVWSFRGFFYYKLSQRQNPFSIGLGFFHHSNGHTRLPNQGINSALLSLSKPVINRTAEFNKNKIVKQNNSLNSSYFFSIHTGVGINSLSIPDPFNDAGLISTNSLNFGKIIGTNYKVGVGAYYSFYEHYYDYISNNESLVQDGREFESLKNAPFWNASALGISASGELLLNHVGIEARLGFNIHKPAYKIDKRINQGWYFFPREFPADSGYPLGELNTKYKLKRFISTRLGLNYYLISTHKKPRHNIYIGAHINANLGQADYTEFNVGYLHTFKKSQNN